MTVVTTGQKVPVSGWFVDRHGHRLFLQRDHLAPICPYLGPEPTAWRLVRPVEDDRPR